MPVCLGCHKPLAGHDALCAKCWRSIDFIRAPLCDRLGIPMPFATGGTIVSAAALADPPDYDRARAAAHLSQMPEAQFSVSKYQLIPNTGITAANKALQGIPNFKPIRAAVRKEYPALVKRISARIRVFSQISARFLRLSFLRSSLLIFVIQFQIG